MDYATLTFKLLNLIANIWALCIFAKLAYKSNYKIMLTKDLIFQGICILLLLS